MFPLDLWDSGNIGGLAAECPDIDLLVDDAGAIPGGNLDAVDEARWRTAWDLKVFGYINMTRRFHALMRAIPWCSRHWPISPGALRSRWCSIGPRHLSLPADQLCHLGYDATPFLDDADAILVLECDVPWVPSLKAPRPGCKIVHLGVDPLFSRCPIRGFACDLAVTAAPEPVLPELAAALDWHTDMAAVVARRARVAGLGKGSARAGKRPARRRRACGRSIWPGPAPASPAPSPKTRSWSTNTTLMPEHCGATLPGCYFGFEPGLRARLGRGRAAGRQARGARPARHLHAGRWLAFVWQSGGTPPRLGGA